jgi:hypothetical protein
MDHMTVDVAGKRLMLSALASDSVEVLDLASGKELGRLSVKEPSGIVYVPEYKAIFVSSEGDNAVQIFDGDSYKLVQTVEKLKHADNLRFEARTRRVYVGYGDDATDSGLGIIDGEYRTAIGEIPLEAHPESFSVERSGGSRRIYINVPDAGHIAVVDSGRRRVMAKWTLPGVREFYPMALDEAGGRLFIGSRNPPKLVVLDTKSGEIVAKVDGPADADDLFYDPARKRLYMTGGEGVVVVYQQQDPDHYQQIARITTARGAKTSLFVPEMNRLFVAIPRSGQHPAAIQVYEAQP